MIKIFVFGPTENSHVKNWNSFYEGCVISLYTLHGAGNNHLLTIFARFIKVFSETIFGKYDICHVHFASSYGILFRLLFLRCNISVISIWGTDFNRFFGDVGLLYRVWGVVILWALNRYDYINVPSLDIYQKIEKIGVDEKKIILMQYGIELGVIKDSLSKTHVFNIPNRFISVRNFSPLYNIEFLINGFSRVSKNICFELQIVGMGTPSECDRIKSLISGLNDDRIQYIGLTDSSELIRLLIEAEYFVSIPSMDGLSLVVLEALACRCKGIVSDIPSYQNKLFSTTCEFIELSDMAQFSAQIEAMVSSKKLGNPESQDLEPYDIEKNRIKFRKIIGLHYGE
jgi:glycosyltransferase involved in cell wall biosynthesis